MNTRLPAHSWQFAIILLASLVLIPSSPLVAQKMASEMRVTVTGHDVNRPDD